MLQVMALFLLAFCVFAGVGLALVLTLDRSRRARQRRLVRFTVNHPQQADDKVARRLDAGDERKFPGARTSGVAALMQARIREAGLDMTPGAAVAIMAAVAGAVFVALLLAGLRSPLLSVPVAGGAGYLLFNFYLGFLRSRRVAAFTEALPDSLDMLARSLRSGQPVAAALKVVAEHATGVTEEEFGFCCEEMRLGVGLVEAFGGIAERVGSPEARFIAIATGLQVETGGNLIETLENLATMLRERRKLRRKAAALSAEVRVSAGILCSLPFVVGAALWVMNGDYLMPLISDPRGRVMALAGLASLGLGIYSMYRLARLDV